MCVGGSQKILLCAVSFFRSYLPCSLRLAAQKVPEVHLSLLPQHGDYKGPGLLTVALGIELRSSNILLLTEPQTDFLLFSPWK